MVHTWGWAKSPHHLGVYEPSPKAVEGSYTTPYKVSPPVVSWLKQKTHYVSTIDPSCPQLSYLGGLTGRICSSHFQTISLFTRVAGRSCAGRQAFHPRWFAIHWQDAQPAIWGVPNSKKPKLNGKPSINSECSSINVGFSQTQWRLYNRNIIHKWLIFHGIFPFCQVCGHGRIQPSVCRMMD